MRWCILCLVCTNMYIGKAQVYTRGGACQLYWDWRPDIASNCYEFTFENYTKVNLLPPHYDDKVGLIFWNDCNYGKSYVMDSNNVMINVPLHDTLYRITSYYGERDTICGFDAPYDPGTNLNFAEKTSPLRTKIVYKGLVYLPEKCNRWYFSPATFFPTNGAVQYYFTNGFRAGDESFNNTRSNIDSTVYWMVASGLMTKGSFIRVPVGCSFNNTEFSNNSSSRFITQVPNYFPIGKDVAYNAGNFDPDHDSIVYSIPDTIKSPESLGGGLGGSAAAWGGGMWRHDDTLGNPITDILTTNYFFAPIPGASGPNPIRYNAQNNPFDTDSTFHLVDSTGRITFNARSEMTPVLYTKATEYRKGKFLSETFIINQFTLINENREPSYMKIDTPTVQHALFNHEGTMMSCTGLNISFDAYVKLPIPGGELVVRTTADTTLPGNASCTLSGLYTDSVHLQFNWTVPSDARGLYKVYVSAKDTNCSPPFNHYLQVYTWSFYIDSCLSPLFVTIPEKNTEMRLYPNPASNELNILYTENGKGSYEIMNVMGAIVSSGNCLFREEKTTLDIQSLGSGFYYLRVHLNGKQLVLKFLIDR